MNWINLSTKKILVAEDETSNYLFLKELLEDSGATIIWAKTGQEVINQIVYKGVQVDLVLMDIKMPELNGLAATRIIKERFPELPVIAQTAYAMKEEKEKCLAGGCDDYIAKPIDIDELIKKIKKYLEK